LIRLSLLPTSHPLGFQPKWVRSSTRYNPRFNLLMGSSRSFASTTSDPLRPIQTRFPWGFGPEGLNLAADGNSPDHYAKGTPSRFALTSHSAPTACRHMVSGSVTSPSRGSSHLSVALLSLLSVVREYLALRDGPRRFSRDSTWLDLLRYSSRGDTIFAYGTVTRYGATFQKLPLTDHFVTLM
jgi:hypothetical protein